MTKIPSDPFILLSYINTQLRDFYPSLEECCKSLGLEPEQLKNNLKKAGYCYDSQKNQFI